MQRKYKMINANRYQDGRFFSIYGNQLHKSFKMFDFNGKKRTIKKSCDLCRFAELTEDEKFFICTVDNIPLNEALISKSVCDNFDISDLMLDDLFTRCR